jgi:hypothetical protein
VHDLQGLSGATAVCYQRGCARMLFLALMLGVVTGQAAQQVVTVRATGDCPSAAAIGEKLGKLLGAAGPGRAPDVAEVDLVGATLAIRLRDPSGQIVGDKRLPAGAGCAERAESAAIVLAAWEAQLGDHAAAGLVAPVTPPPIREAAPAAAASTAPRPPAAAPAGGWGWSVGGSLLAAIDSADTALAATAEATVSRAASPFALGASAIFVNSHATEVAPGTGSWRRFGLVLDARRRSRWPLVWLEARAGVALTILRITGSGLSENSGGTAFDPGAVAGLRLGLVGNPATAWIEASATLWPRRQTLDVRGGGAADLPLVDGLVGIGFSFERSP